ncbi:hypothetical protein [Caldalkalibacillus salinus]|uniref:hypothetical protein n=1 Tax=Caldalkalibacillus salinus TaxID=2803787 RepID=UPI0019212C11|nr:hypothetical protein [Caldalkalibacillus salinus]
MSTGLARFSSVVAPYQEEGEEFKRFSYTYRKDGVEYHNVYFFDRKKGPYKVTGFLVVDGEYEVVSREKAIEINEGFNLYNDLYRRFQAEWGDVVQQDMRKYNGSVEHFERLLTWLSEQSSEEINNLGESAEHIISWVQEGQDTVRQVLEDQDVFLQLDLDAIALGERKNNQGYIDDQILEEVKRIRRHFEYKVFHQLDIQFETKASREKYIHWADEHKPPKEIKKSVKKVKKIFKRMNKLVSKFEERMIERKKDPYNEERHHHLVQQWTAKLRN